ncbi:hypothetical protein ACN20G_01360 [Streptomyces sp. BI20]|uniref:hypothetical protein n=1 Tax=Streptomyces sp. BI20 TaxID=3403460 RepID=UPI003C715A53
MPDDEHEPEHDEHGPERPVDLTARTARIAARAVAPGVGGPERPDAVLWWNTDPAEEPRPRAAWLPRAIRPRECRAPAPGLPFVGRTGDVVELASALASARSGTWVVTGPRGVGKSELLRHTLAGLRADPRGRPDAVLHVDLAEFGSDEPPAAVHRALGRLLRDLGLPAGAVPQEPEGRARVFREVLTALTAHGLRVLIALDHAGEPGDLAPLLPPPDTALALIAGREPALASLADRTGDGRLVLGRLSEADAAELVRAAARAASGETPGGPVDELARRRAPDAGVVARVVAASAGLPAALRLRAGSGTVGGAPRTAGPDGAGETPTGPLADRAVHAALDVARARLGHDGARLLRLLTLADGRGLVLAEVTALWGEDAEPAWAGRALADLVRAGLVEHRPAGTVGTEERWLLPHPWADRVAEEAQRRAREDGRAVAWRRLGLHRAGLAGQAVSVAEALDRGDAPPPTPDFEHPTEALAWLEEHEREIVAGAHRSTELRLAGPAEVARDLLELCETLRPWFARRAAHGAWARLASLTAMVATAAGDPGAEARALHLLADCCLDRALWDRAEGLYAGVLDRAAALVDPAARARALDGRGRALSGAGRTEEAERALRAAVAAYGRAGRTEEAAEAWRHLGLLAAGRGKGRQALSALERSTRAATAAGDRRALAAASGDLGLALLLSRRPAESLARHVTARELCRAVGDRAGEGRELTGEGCALRALGRTGEALERFAEAAAVLRSSGDAFAEHLARGDLAPLLRQTGRPEEALEAGARVTAFHERIGADRFLGIALLAEGSGLLARERPAEALPLLERAVALLAALPDARAEEGEAQGALAQALRGVGRHAEALDAHARDLALARARRDRPTETAALRGQGITLRELGREREAFTALRKSSAAGGPVLGAEGTFPQAGPAGAVPRGAWRSLARWYAALTVAFAALAVGMRIWPGPAGTPFFWISAGSALLSLSAVWGFGRFAPERGLARLDLANFGWGVLAFVWMLLSWLVPIGVVVSLFTETGFWDRPGRAATLIVLFVALNAAVYHVGQRGRALLLPGL